MSGFQRFRADDRGAALIEYSILIGLISAAVVGAIVLLSPWLVAQWTTLITVLGL
jgi:pilus assembly protein Flp/PilA